MPPHTRASLEALRIRGHHLLCMFGFRGLGYSPEFVENMQAVVDSLFSPLGVEVEVIAVCDDICRACPHLRHGECGAREGSEVSVRAKDQMVLSRLGLVAGDRAPSALLVQRVIESISSDALADICARCQWQPAGYCQEGLRRAGDALTDVSREPGCRPHTAEAGA